MTVRRRVPKPVVKAVVRGAPKVVKTITRAAKGAMPRGTSARVNPKEAKARAAYTKKADTAEGRRRAMVRMGQKNQKEIERMKKAEQYKKSGQNPFRNPYGLKDTPRQLERYVNPKSRTKKK